MVIFYDSSRTLNDQSITLLRSTKEPVEEGVVLKVHPPGSSVPSPSSTAIPCPPSLSRWWVESSHELHDPTRKDLHVVSRTFTLASNLHSTVDHINPFPLLGCQISVGEVQWALPSFKTPPLQYKGEVFISLWDLHLIGMIGKLLVYGSFYEEVIPNSKDISSLLSCCRHLHVTAKVHTKYTPKASMPPRGHMASL
uniref:Uncharacterized protein n=1 Tax=Quercus lobata TaxID=97700 RepID=A0A7N2KPD7_QUELO